MASKNCLLCYKDCSTNSSIKSPGAKENNTGRGSQVENQVIIFAIRELLGIPKDFCHKILPPRKDPSEWITSCENCSKLMEDAYATFKEITKLQCRFNCLKTKVNETIQKSIGHNFYAFEKEHVNKTDIIRKFLCTNLNKRNCDNTISTCQTSNTVLCEDADLLESKDDEEMEIKIEGSSDKEENGEEFYPPFEDCEEEFDDAFCEKKFSPTDATASPSLRNTSDKSGLSGNPDQSTKQVPDDENMDIDKTQKGLRNSKSITTKLPKSNDNQESESSDSSEPEDSLNESDTDTNDDSSNSDTADSEISENELLEKRNKKKAEIFHCEHCGNYYPTKYSLQSHINYKHTTNKYKCSKCPKEFIRQYSLNTHCAKYHPEIYVPPAKMPCEICEKSVGQQNKEKHACSNSKATLKCELCDKQVFVGKYADHKRAYHYKELNLEPFQCDKCHKVLKSQRSLESHMISRHLKNYSILCSICNDGFITNSNLQTHIKAVHEKVKDFSCTICDHKFSYKSSLENHIARKHTKDFKFICAVCGFRSVSDSSLKLHMSVHSESKSFTCKLCGEAFRQKSNLSEHQRGKHYKELNLEPFKCSDCGQILNSYSSLRNHSIRVHTKKFKSICTFCDKSFINNSTLQNHIRAKHTGERPFKCSSCDKKFFSKQKLKMHSQIHSEFKFKCQMCEKGYATNWELGRHMKTH